MIFQSLRWRFTLWFTLSILAVLLVFIGVTYTHLQHELRVERWERVQPGHQDWTLHGSYSETEVNDIAGELWHLSLLYSAPVILLALGLGYYLARHSFRPVQSINRQLQAIGPRSLDQRLRLAHADAEFRTIEDQINALLDRLDLSFRQLSDFSAQVAHELRTPLTLLRLQIEEAADGIEPTLAESLQDELRRLSDYVEQCLLLATAEQGRLTLDLQPVALPALIAEMLDVYELLARAQGRELSLETVTDATVTTDPRSLRQILHNLLTNALRHGTGAVTLQVGREGAAVVCRVSNPVHAAPTSSARPVGSPKLGLRIVHAVSRLLPGLTFATPAQPGHFVAELRWQIPPESPPPPSP